MHIIGIETEGLGTNNQMRGIIMSAAKIRRKDEEMPVSREALLKSPNGIILHPKNFETMQDFQNAVQASVDDYLSENKAPDFVVLPLNHAYGVEENQDVDVISFAIKQAFEKHKHHVNTMVMASNVYDYKHVDIIHTSKHLLFAKDEEILKESTSLKTRVVETLGVPSNISWMCIRTLAHQPEVEKALDKYRKISDNKLIQNKENTNEKTEVKKNVLFSLGGITDNGAIGFDLKDAENLFKSALKLKTKGYNVIFTNSPRTPSDVTDYLYEKCKLFHMEFFNSKKIAQTKEEEKNFRNYNGKYKKEFDEQAKSVGNIYPAVLDVCEFVVNTHDSFSYTSDAAALGIPSVVYTRNFIDEERRPDCYKLFDLCHKEGHVISLDEALKKIDKGESLKTKKMDDVSTQLVKAMTKFLSNVREQSNTTSKIKD